jgi:3-isopropylmalate/(R)-2-methylmalate dehydratase small subunit
MPAITRISGRALPMRGNDIDTDRIIPARFLTSITFDGMEQHVFEDDRKSPGGPYNRHPFDVSHFQGAAVLLVNSNFGCGSSREHAPQALHRWGIQVVLGESFAEIFFGNSGMIGMPCVTASPADVAALMDLAEREPATAFDVDLVTGTCRAGELAVPIALPPKMREAFTSGAWDTTGMLLADFDEVRETSSRLPYSTATRSS